MAPNIKVEPFDDNFMNVSPNGSPNGSPKGSPKVSSKSEPKDGVKVPTRKSVTYVEPVNQDNHKYRLQIVWRNVIIFALLHIGAIYGFYLCLTQAKWTTVAFAYFLYVYSGLGITAGAHRLWSHRSYKAKWPLRLFLAVANTIAFENDIYEWTRDHRVHHLYSETDADPHDSRRGFFFAHVGWLLCRKHPAVIEKGKKVDCSDVLKDPIVRFQRRYYLPLVITWCFIIPTIIPYFAWNESLWISYFVCSIFRYCFTLNMTWLVNSAAHMWGNQPYDKSHNARENIGVSLGAIGEGFHNYHHTFPYDYSASELGWEFNLTKFFIDSCAVLGLVYDRRKVSKEVLKRRVQRTGDGSHHHHHH